MGVRLDDSMILTSDVVVMVSGEVGIGMVVMGVSVMFLCVLGREVDLLLLSFKGRRWRDLASNKITNNR